jgi:hypothetical protein
VPSVRARLAVAGFDTMEAGPGAFRAIMEAETVKWSEAVRGFGLRPE